MPRLPISVAERITERSIHTDDGSGCILWRSGVADGYAMYMKVDGKVVSVLKTVYETQTGNKLGVSQQLRHTCKSKRCINVKHLKVVG